MKLKEILDGGQYDRKEIARAAGISKGHLSHIENGTRTPSMGAAKRLVSIFGGKLTLEDLAPEGDEVETSPA